MDAFFYALYILAVGVPVGVFDVLRASGISPYLLLILVGVGVFMLGYWKGAHVVR